MATFNFIAGIASITGLAIGIAAVILSGLAYREAKLAKNVAAEARDSVIVRTLVDELQFICLQLEQLLDLLEQSRWPEASLTARSLTSALSELPFRRSQFLTNERQQVTLTAREQMNIIGRELWRSRTQELPAERQNRLIRICRETATALREILGAMRGNLDTGRTP
jgi:hypothetical protein